MCGNYISVTNDISHQGFRENKNVQIPKLIEIYNEGSIGSK